VLLATVLVFLLALPFLVRVTVRYARRERDRVVAARTPAVPSRPPIERVTADLRRLRAQLERCENRPGTTGKGLRMGALRAAYVDVLGIACQQLEVTPPRTVGRLQPDTAELYRVESELRQRGLDVRPPDWRSHAA
jgi:hypothetical protein